MGVMVDVNTWQQLSRLGDHLKALTEGSEAAASGWMVVRAVGVL